MNYKEAKSKLEQINKKLTIYDFINNKKSKKIKIVEIRHCDGSYLKFYHACIKKLDKEWTVVCTEHHGNFLYHFEDVEFIREIKK